MTNDEPVAYAIYGRKTGQCREVRDDLSDDDLTELAEFYDVVPLYPRIDKETQR